MGRFKERYKFLDYIFAKEKDIAKGVSAVDAKIVGSPERWLKVIVETYETAKQKKLEISEIASRRFHNKEFYICTCLEMCISPAKYYRLLSIFFKIAEQKIEKIFSSNEK